MSSSELYNSPAVVLWRVNKEKGQEANVGVRPPLHGSRETNTFLEGTNLSPQSDLIRHLSFCNCLAELCNLTLDTTTP